MGNFERPEGAIGLKPQTLRRASYGPTSPTVGVRGIRTREQIIAETLKLFALHGFADTTVHQIADAAEISRAAMYQYFESKDDVLLALLDECEVALSKVLDEVGSLGPSAEGFDQLREWIAGWSRVHERYGVLFVRWAGVDLPPEQRHMRRYEQQVAHRLLTARVESFSPQEAAVLVTDAVHRFNFLRLSDRSPGGDFFDAVTDVATVLQLVLFPSTPLDIFEDGPGRTRASVPPAPAPRGESRLDQIMGPLSDRSVATVYRIIRAGAQSFAELGYHRANVDAIVRGAGYARGTFYKYFSEKIDLLRVLADEYEDRASMLIGQFGQLPMDEAGAAKRREWVTTFLSLRARYLGVMRTLVDLMPADEALDASRDRFRVLITSVLTDLVESGPLKGVVSAWAAEVLLIGALDRLCDMETVLGHDSKAASPRQATELFATVVERGLLGLGRADG